MTALATYWIDITDLVTTMLQHENDTYPRTDTPAPRASESPGLSITRRR